MPRFLIRAGSASDWMIWDRLARGPATFNNRKLNKLSRESAETALAKLLSPEERADVAPRERWQVLYAGAALDCHDESEAKIIARTLLKKGVRVSVRLANGEMMLLTIEGRDQIRAWLSK